MTKAEEFARLLADGVRRDNGFIDIAYYQVVLEQYGALVREGCAKECEAYALLKEEDSDIEPDEDYKLRFKVYAKHVRRVMDNIIRMPLP